MFKSPVGAIVGVPTAPALTTICPVPFPAIVMFPLAPSAIVIAPEFVPEFVLRIRSPAPLEVIVALAPLSPTLTVSASKRISPVPLGAIVILASAPSAIVIEPELEPEFVLSIKSPVPSVVIVALAFEYRF